MTNLLAIFMAICIVESGDNDYAYNQKEKALGAAQIRPCVVSDVNRIYGTGYQHEDAADKDDAYRIFCLYVRHWCREERLGRVATWEDIARVWNGGPRGYRKAATVRYWEKVRAALREGGK